MTGNIGYKSENLFMRLVKHSRFRKIMVPVTAVLSVIVAITVAFLLMKPATTITKINPDLSVEYTNVQLGQTAPLTVKATGAISAEVFTLTFSGDGAGLSEEYIFENDQTSVIDTNGNTIILNREIGGNGAVNYWFELKNGQETEFSLNCISGVFVTTVFDLEDYKSCIATDDEATIEAELEQMIKADHEEKLSSLESASLCIVGGCGKTLDDAKKDTANNEPLNLNWVCEPSPKMMMMRAASNETIIADDFLNETVKYKITQDNYTGKYTITIYGEGDMTDFTSSNYTKAPWYPYKSNLTRAVIEDGITSVGTYSFYQYNLTSVSFGKDVQQIKGYAFRQCDISSLYLPSNIKTIASMAFYSNKFTKVTLEEGLVSLDGANLNSVTQSNIHIPSTLTTYGQASFVPSNSSFTVDERNPVYFAQDGVLYKYLSNGGVELVAYPRNKKDEIFEVPDFVTAVNGYAFCRNTYIKKIIFTAPITLQGNESIYSCTALEEVVISEGSKITSIYFISTCSSLKKVIIPEDVNMAGMLKLVDCNSLEEIYIPKTVKTIYDQTFGKYTRSLQTVYYDAESVINYKEHAEVPRKYDLIIGDKVNALKGVETGQSAVYKYGFQSMLLNAKSVKFVGENQITISKPVIGTDGNYSGVFDSMPAPLNGLVGTVWVDAQGVVYKYDSKTLTASVAYVPFDVTEVIIPETITPESSITCTVNSVDNYAFKLAEKLETLSFDNPQAIEKIGAYGIGYCNKLTSLNGCETVEEAEATFTNENINFGYRWYFGNGLKVISGTGVDLDNTDGLKVVSIATENHEPLYISVQDEYGTLWDSENDIGMYKTLTGSATSVNMYMSSIDTATNNIYRVYFELSDLSGSLSIAPGESITMHGTEMTCYATEAPNIVYIEFIPVVGTTVNIAVEANFPSPNSSGGNLRVWGMAFKADSEQYTQSIGEIVDYSTTKNPDGTVSHLNAIHVAWSIQPDEFMVTKSVSGNTTIAITGDGNGNLLPTSETAYTISYKRASSDTLSYGKDYVRSVDFYDYVDFSKSEGTTRWNSDVVEKIKNGECRYSGGYYYVGDLSIARIAAASGSATITTGSMSYDESKGIVFHWRIYNASSVAEIATSSFTFTIYKDAISFEPSLISTVNGTKYTYTNNVEAVSHYTYSEDKSAVSSVDKYFSSATGTLRFNKAISDRTTLYFGSPITYTLSIYNNGSMPYYGVANNVYRMEDTMSPYTYITPENIEKMFKDKYRDTLTLTINNALIYKRKAVTSQDSNTAYITASNSDVEHTHDTLTLTWNSEQQKIQVARLDGTTLLVETTLKDLFNEIGYSVGFETTFATVWLVNDENTTLTLLGGQYEYFYIYANYKDTFMMLDGDYPNYYPIADAIAVKNNGYLYRSGSTKAVSSYAPSSYMKREAYISKSGFLNSTGEHLGNDFSIKLDDVIDYTVDFKHFGSGKYENLPLIDDIYGTQVLLVPVEQNPQLADLGLGTATAIEHGYEVEFYKLSKSGTYHNVVVGYNRNNEYMTADTITVTAVGEETDITVDGTTYTYSGLRTSINWYYTELEGGEYELEVNYHTLVDSEQLHSSKISTGNIAWMNDKTNDRIYDSLWGSGSLIDADKKIVYKNEDGTYTEDPDDYCIIDNGDSVTYRLDLYNPNDYAYTLNGTYFYDELPVTGNIFTWEKDVNISIEWEEKEGVAVTNLDNWYIDDQIYGVYQDGVYFMKWNADTVVTIDPFEKFSIYVTLQYPQNTENSTAWSDYYVAVNGSKVENSFVLYGGYHSVYHSLKEQASVTLQKGVYATYRYTNPHNTTNNTFTETPSRIYYNNRDSKGRAISYYVVLYNEGYTRLYLNDIYDELPKGFTFSRMMNNTTIYTHATTQSFSSTTNPYTVATLSDSEADPIQYMSALVVATPNDNGVSFALNAGTGQHSIKYDNEEEKYYLEHNEAIVFGYVCSIAETTQTEDLATNTIGMEFYDYLGAGVRVADDDKITIVSKTTDVYSEQNDGTRSVKKGSDISPIYSFAQNAHDESEWLLSDVSVQRGGIIPGVTNFTDSYVNTGSDIVNKYTTSVSPFATINWRSRLHNSGTSSITDYTFVDSLPAPYGLTGKVAINIYDEESSLLSSFNLFTVTERTDEYLTVVGAESMYYTIMLDGTVSHISVYDSSSYSYVNTDVSVTRDENGQETLTIHFQNRMFSIPENGGYVDVTLSSVNIPNIYENTVYTNFSYLIPNVQQYDSAAQGSIVFEDENIEGVVNNSPANVSIGYATTSLKAVHELSDTDNATTSEKDKKYIILKDKRSEFRYTLTVTNDTNFAMTKLILIDSLPQIGDHSPFDNEALRGSEFKVSLAQTPDFKLTVYPEDGESYTLSSDYFTVGYSSDTTFTAQDWNGTAQWNNDTTNVRSLRLFFSDSTASQIPPHAKVEFSFNAVVDDENAKAGMTAWNSFGYHYGLDGVPFELEAMPLSVGVKVPDVPTLQKKLVDLKGNTFNTLSDDTFSFIIYSGDAITSQYNTTAEFLELLEADSREHTQVNLTVTEGESVSDKIKLELTDWVWTKGNTYTIAEITENDDYSLLNWNNANVKHVSFVYDPDRSISYTCTNTWQRWSFEVLKTDGVTNAFLNNAVFALYSPYEADLISDEKYNALTTKPQMIYTDTNSVNWYLCDIKTTNESGLCTFEKLNRASYYLIEAKSPDGYKLDLEPRLITNSQLLTQVEIKNYTMTVLPFTGGNNNLATIGVIIFTIAVFALVFLIVRKKHLKAL